MRNIILLTLVIFSLNIQAQLTSYEDNYDKIETTFNMSFQLNNDNIFILSALKDYEMQAKLSLGNEPKRLDIMKSKAFTASNCEDCSIYQTKITDEPLDYIFKVIEEGDVFIVAKEKDKYKVDLYRHAE